MDNDNKILELKQRIAEKRKILGKAKRFQPITNCILNFHGTTYNLNTLDAETLAFLLCDIQAVINAAGSLTDDIGDGQVLSHVRISGFSLAEWKEDIVAKFNSKFITAKQRELDSLEKELDSMLSTDKKREVRIGDIAELLGNF